MKPSQIIADNMQKIAKAQKEKTMSEPHKLVSGSHKPNERDKKKDGGGMLVMLATKFEMREMRRDPKKLHFVLVCKDVLISTNNLPPLHSAITHVLEDFEDVFPKEISAGLPPLQGIDH